MANEDKQPGKYIANNGLIVAVLILTGAAVFVQRAPLKPARPPVTETSIQQTVAKEDVEARLWQDPLGAAVKEYRERIGKAGTGKSRGSTKA